MKFPELESRLNIGDKLIVTTYTPNENYEIVKHQELIRVKSIDLRYGKRCETDRKLVFEFYYDFDHFNEVTKTWSSYYWESVLESQLDIQYNNGVKKYELVKDEKVSCR